MSINIRKIIHILIFIVTLSSMAHAGNKILLIGGPASHTIGEHDFPHGITFIESLLKQSPDIADLKVEAHPFHWPSDEAFQNVATVVFYLDGAEIHPLLDPKKRAQIEKLMNEGAGMIALHQASTLPVDNTSVPLLEWLGGARFGLEDRTIQPAELMIPDTEHELTRGVNNFIHHDEYYPTIRYNNKNGKITPIWTANLRTQFVKGEPVISNDTLRTVSWAYERENGGRSFTYTGGHFLEAWDKAPAKTLLLNAIIWTAGRNVPANGATSAIEDNLAAKLAFPGRELGTLKEAIMIPAKDVQILPQPWGQLDWHVSGYLGNSDSITTGIATVSVGKANPRHYHPNCVEILHVVKGHIRHTMDDVVVEMKAGDTVSIPIGVYHNAINIGDEDAVLAISFSSAWREAIGE